MSKINQQTLKSIILIIVSLSLISCYNYSTLNAKNKNFFQSENINSENNSTQQYQDVGKIFWDFDETPKIQATLEILKNKKESLSGTVPLSKLTVTNLTSNQIIFKKESNDTPLSIYKGSMEEVGECFIIIWGAGSADRIEIFTVSENEVKNVLSESYRIDASIIDLSGEGKKNVLISTTNDKTGELIIKNFSWNGSKFLITGIGDYKKFVKTIRMSFNMPNS